MPASSRWILALVLMLPAPALAREAVVATSAGTAGEAASELARQTGTSIVIADLLLARRPVPALRGRMEEAEAVRALARAAGARAVSAGPSAWRLVPVSQPQSAVPAAPRQPVRTQEAQPPAPPIVVMASKRDLRIDQIPAQVSVLDGASLETGGVGGTEKITQRLATVSSTHLGSGRNKLFIRGIADSSFTGPTQATVGQYLGDLRLAYNAPDPDLRLSDMARVEVLEGPQGTLYGAGSLGGIIRLVANPPVMGATSAAGVLGGSLTQDGEPGGDVSATVNLPLAADSAALRATFDAMHLGGYIDKPVLGRSNVNDTDIIGGRLSARVELAPDWSVDLVGLGQTTKAADSQYADRHGTPLTSSARVREGSDADYAMGQLVVSGRIGAVRLRSTTGLVRQHLHERYDATMPDGPPRVFAQANRTRMIANETRIWMPERGGFGWLLGASFTHNDASLTRRFESEDSRSTATGVDNTIDELTLYGEASLRLSPTVVATAGGRFTRSRLGGEGQDVLPAIALAFARITASHAQEKFLPSLALHAELAPETLMYMRYQEGFRPGGLAIEGDFVRRFRSDRTRTFEIGARRGQTSDTPYEVAMSLSYTRWKDIQADFIDGAGLPSTANIGDGRIWSASLSAAVAVTDELRLEAGVTWNRSKVDQPPLALSSRAMQVPNIAHIAGRAGVAWNHRLSDDLKLTANGWASYVGRSRLGIGPELGEPQGDYLDSGVDVRVGSDSRGVTLSVTNIGNARGNRFSLGTPFSTGREQITPLRPRTIRIGLDTRF